MRMQRVNLGAVDMNLLVALDALLAEQSVTRAARRVGLTQPAMSHALSRLRELLGDPLFVRTRAGMEPTARALALAPTLSRSLADIERAIAEPPRFEPAIAKRVFSIATTDYTEFILLPSLVPRLVREAPGVDLHVRNAPNGLSELEQGTLDVVIRPSLAATKAGIHSEPLFEERFVCVVRRGHPLAKRKLTLDRYCRAAHVLVSPHGPRSGFVDEQLEKVGRSRRVSLVLQHFLVAPHVIASTDLIATVGERIARAFERMLGLAVLALPLEVPPLALSQFWHERQQHDPALLWLRGELRAATQES